MTEPGPSGRPATSSTPDPYAVLAVSRSADKAELLRAYRRAVRRTHPDMGGSAAEFAAVQAAWEALTGAPPEPVDEWALGDWGVDVDAPDGPAATTTADTTAADAASEDPPGSQRTPTLPPEDDDLPFPGPHAHRDPFAPGAVRLPEPTLVVPRRRPATGANRLDRALPTAIGIGVLTIASTAAFSGSLISTGAYWTVGVWAFVLALGILMARKLGVGSAISFLSMAVLLAAGPAMVDRHTPPSVVLLVGTALTSIAILVREFRKLHTPAPGNDRLRDAARMGPALERHDLARRWNDVRHALTTPGSTVERLVGSGLPRPEQRWLGVDARTGLATVRDLGGLDAEAGSWVVLDAAGSILATAPRDAPGAWSATVRKGARR